MFKIIKVTGDSMSPEFMEGDFVLLLTLPITLHFLKAGDVVVFRYYGYGTLIKRISGFSADEIVVSGTQTHSLDSRRLGSISRKHIIGKVIWHIRKA